MITSRACAPSAIRSPISRRRCATTNASTPYNPIAASDAATTPNAVSSVTLNRRRVSEFDSCSSIVRTAPIGCSLSTRQSRRARCWSSVPGGAEVRTAKVMNGHGS